ncbi:hypothetical protein [Sphingomonas sp. SRS2]|uniref:hypothetical protein n=1 Tax=Sphingomonas sp. SRS2 TaxID=133190 RepID=UPI00061845E3|nr:hypothetical protein [Sphingomonas sp. SRS2]KKC24635.1 hypothetical protein WP12_18200 [Sphingomonas sp. SRS2]
MAVLMAWTTLAAIVAVIAALGFLSAGPGPMHRHEIIATIFGVGLTVLLAGGLSAAMYRSAASGRDDLVGRAGSNSQRTRPESQAGDP